VEKVEEVEGKRGKGCWSGLGRSARSGAVSLGNKKTVTLQGPRSRRTNVRGPSRQTPGGGRKEKGKTRSRTNLVSSILERVNPCEATPLKRRELCLAQHVANKAKNTGIPSKMVFGEGERGEREVEYGG